MNSRRIFFATLPCWLLAAAMPVVKVLADDPVKTTASTTGKLPFTNTYVKNVSVTEHDFRNAKPNIYKSPGFLEANDILPNRYWKENETELIIQFLLSP